MTLFLRSPLLLAGAAALCACTGGASNAGGSGGASGNQPSWPAPTSPDSAAFPSAFWQPAGAIPVAKNVMTFVFLNRTGGKLDDGEIFWRFQNDKIGVNELHSFSAQPTYDMPANGSGRMYFYLCGAATQHETCATDPTKSPYYDFIEFTIGGGAGQTPRFNGNTTRVDAFGLKIAMRLVCPSDSGFDQTVGEDATLFAEDRAATFQRFQDEVPAEFKGLARAPYRIVEPGAGAGGFGGQYQTYYASNVEEIWTANGLTVPQPGPNGSGLGSYPDLSAAIYRHVGGAAGTFDPSGKLLDKTLWSDAKTFYATPPADYYAKFWHDHGVGGRAYGFPYDDVGSYSTYMSCANPAYLLIAIGW
jgi:hypothetical protein